MNSSDYSFNLYDQYDDGYDVYPDPGSTYVYGASGQDTISFSSSADSLTGATNTFTFVTKQTEDVNVDRFWKFNEGKTMKALDEYLKSTYHSHYTSEKSKVQVLDIIDAIGDGVPFCRDNLIKYASRFGKKNGMSRLDALKIMHYGVLLYHFAGFHTNTSDTYETF
jgi:hypothetical protein